MSLSSRRFLFLLCSTRRLGNTEQLAYYAAHHLPTETERNWLNLVDYPLPDYVDLRHNGPYPAPAGNAKILLKATLQATDLVLVAPLYWYSLPTPGKHYLDYWGGWLRTPGIEFREEMRGKTLWLITAGTGPRAEAQPLEDMLRLTATYMQMQWGGVLFGSGSRPNDIQMDTDALHRAKSFFVTASELQPR